MRGGRRSGAGGGRAVAWRLGRTVVGSRAGASCSGARCPHERPTLRLTFRGTCGWQPEVSARPSQPPPRPPRGQPLAPRHTIRHGHSSSATDRRTLTHAHTHTRHQVNGLTAHPPCHDASTLCEPPSPARAPVQQGARRGWPGRGLWHREVCPGATWGPPGGSADFKRCRGVWRALLGT